MRAAGVPRANIVTQTISGAAKSRPKLRALLERLKPGDALLLWKLDGLGRTALQVLETFQDLAATGVGVRVLTQPIDTTTSFGRMIVTIIAAVAEMERDLIRERINAGVKAAKARGQQMGRRPRLTPHRRREAARLIDEGKSYGEVAALLGVSKTVAYEAVRAVRAAEQGRQ